MKKWASALLLLILTTTFLYNAIGCHLLFTLKEEQSWIKAMQKIPDAEFKIIKVNASLYSFMEDSELEYVNENVTLKNKVYHIFKKQIKDNIIYLYYLPNEMQTAVDLSLKKLIDSELFDNSALSKKPLEKLFMSFIKDYIPQNDYSFDFSIHHGTLAKKMPTEPIQLPKSGHSIPLYAPPKSLLLV